MTQGDYVQTVLDYSSQDIKPLKQLIKHQNKSISVDEMTRLQITDGLWLCTKCCH